MSCRRPARQTSETNCKANDPNEDDDGADSVAVADGGEHRDPDYEQGETAEEPKGDEALPAIRSQTFVTDHGTCHSLRRR
jgi:hypothetical protein